MVAGVRPAGRRDRAGGRSGVVEAAYFVLLSAAYRRGDLSVVYPIARGTAPLLAVVFGVVVFGERLGVAGSIGVALLLVGFLVLQQPWRVLAVARSAVAARKAAADRPCVRARDRRDDRDVHARSTGLGRGRSTRSPYAAILWVTSAVVLVVWVRFVAGGDLLRSGRRRRAGPRWAAG